MKVEEGLCFGGPQESPFFLFQARMVKFWKQGVVRGCMDVLAEILLEYTSKVVQFEGEGMQEGVLWGSRVPGSGKFPDLMEGLRGGILVILVREGGGELSNERPETKEVEEKGGE